GDWSSDVCSSDLAPAIGGKSGPAVLPFRLPGRPPIRRKGGSMSAYPAWALICAILGCAGAVALLAWNTAQEQRAGRFDSLIAVVARSQSLALFRAVAIARWACIGVLAVAVVGLIRLVALGAI